MLTLTTPNGRAITAETDVHLASQWLDAQYGEDWADGLIPFDEHDLVHSTIDEFALMADGHIPGYTVTES